MEHGAVVFHFAHAKSSQRALLHQWFEQKHIKEWMHGVGLQNTLNGLEKFFQGTSTTTYWVGFDKDVPFAFLITSPEGEDATTLDLFICDTNYLGKGLAVPMIQEFLLSQFSHVKRVLIDPEKANTRAIHVYQKVGFKIIGEFIASWHPVPHYQMELHMENLKNTSGVKQMPNHPTAIIQTERLILRQWCDQDIDPYRKLNADPKVMEFFPATWSQEESDTSLQSARNHIEKYGWGKWAVSLLETDEFIGRIGLEDINFQASFSPNIELGYRIAYKHWGKGYASEGAKAALEYGFQHINLEEIVAFTPIQNLRSQVVMQRIGMHHNRKDDFDHPKLPENHRLRRHVLYRLKAEQWQK